MTVAELGRRMSSAEFSTWIEYADLEPFGPLADGASAAALLNVNRDPKQRAQPFSSREARLLFAFDPEPPKPIDLETKIKTALLALGTGKRRNVRTARRGRNDALSESPRSVGRSE